METTLPTPNLSRAIFSETAHLEIPSRPEWITPTVEYLRDRALQAGVCDEEQADRILLSLHEALTNSIIHGNLEVSSELKELDDNSFTRTVTERVADPLYGDRRVYVDLAYNHVEFQWVLTDEGMGFDHEAAFRRLDSDDPELMLASGRGLMLMRAYMSEVRYAEGGKQCILTWRLPHDEQKRLHPRRSHRQVVNVANVESDGSIDWANASPAFTQNLSEGGIAFLQRQLCDSERVVLGVEYQGKPIYIPAQVRHCSPLQEGMVEVGCCFLFDENAHRKEDGLELAHKAVQELLNQIGRELDGHDERRQHPRLSYTQSILVHYGDNLHLSAYSQNLSLTGIGFLATLALPLEECVIEILQEESKLTLRARIVRCARITEGCFEVGGTFTGLVEQDAVSPSAILSKS